MSRPNTVLSTIHVPDQRTAESELGASLTRAAQLAAANGVSLEGFVQAAWAAYMQANPAAREELEDRALLANLEKLRAKGLIGTA